MASMRTPNALAALSALAMVVLSGCVAPREAAPPPPPRAVPPPPPLPPAPPAGQDWRDIPITPGDWSYAAEAGGTAARFGRAGAPTFEIRCVRSTRAVTLGRLGMAAGAASGAATIDVTTSAGRQVLRGTAQAGTVTAPLQARDPLLDRMAFSRGRFIVVVPGADRLAIPSWPEFARVVEDCRG